MFRLALALGIPDPYAMLDEMPPGLLEQWWDFYEVEPWANQNAQLASILSVLTGKPAYKFGAPRPPISSDDARSVFQAMGLM